jgi:hypothetical protein
MRHSAFKQKLLNSVGSVVRVKSKITWDSYEEDLSDCLCLILPEDVRYFEVGSTSSVSCKKRESVNLLLHGKAVRVFVSSNDIEYI